MSQEQEAQEAMTCARCGRFSGPEVLCARCDEGPQEQEEDGVDADDDLNAEADAAAQELARDARDGPPDWAWQG